MVWLACLRTLVWVAALLRLLVQEQAKGKEEVFFLPSLLLRALHADLPESAPEQEPGMDVRGALRVIAMDLLGIDSEAAWGCSASRKLCESNQD